MENYEKYIPSLGDAGAMAILSCAFKKNNFDLIEDMMDGGPELSHMRIDTLLVLLKGLLKQKNFQKIEMIIQKYNHDFENAEKNDIYAVIETFVQVGNVEKAWRLAQKVKTLIKTF